MKTNIEHQKSVALVKAWKEANQNTIEKVSSYNPKTKAWTLKTIHRDERALDFAKNTKPKRVRKALPKAQPKESKKTISKKTKSPMRENVVRLREKEGKSYEEIAAMYQVTVGSAMTAYSREKKAS